MKLSSYCLELRKLQLYIPSQPNNHKLDLLVQKFSLHTTFKNLLHTPLPGPMEKWSQWLWIGIPGAGKSRDEAPHWSALKHQW